MPRERLTAFQTMKKCTLAFPRQILVDSFEGEAIDVDE